MPARPKTGKENTRNLAVDVGSDLPEELQGLERLRTVLKRREVIPDLPDLEDSPYDFTKLLDFTHNGVALTAVGIEFVIRYITSGFVTPIRPPGANSKSHNQKGVWLLAKPEIQAAIAMLTQNAIRQAQITPGKTIAELAAVAFSNLGDLCNVGPAGLSLKEFSSLPREVIAGVAEVHEIRNAQGTQIRIKMHDKIQALTTLAKLAGFMPSEKIDVDVTHKLEEKLNRALSRVNPNNDVIEGELAK
jgi:hypothetical protein